MDQAERNKLRTLANDAIIDLFGSEGRELKLAQALEQCVDELAYIAEGCETCKFCGDHGDFETDAPLIVESGDVLEIHAEMKKLLQRFKDYHVRLCGEVAEDWADPDQLTEPLAEIIEDTESQIDELEALTFV